MKFQIYYLKAIRLIFNEDILPTKIHFKINLIFSTETTSKYWISIL